MGYRVFGGSLRLLMVMLVAASFSGCSHWGVQPWQRQNLSQPGMSFSAPDLNRTFSEHLYFSREASSGGQSFAAGGCGCN